MDAGVFSGSGAAGDSGMPCGLVCLDDFDSLGGLGAWAERVSGGSAGTSGLAMMLRCKDSSATEGVDFSPHHDVIRLA